MPAHGASTSPRVRVSIRRTRGTHASVHRERSQRAFTAPLIASVIDLGAGELKDSTKLCLVELNSGQSDGVSGAGSPHVLPYVRAYASTRKTLAQAEHARTRRQSTRARTRAYAHA